MIEEIKEFIKNTNPKWQTRKISKEHKQYLKSLYPSYSLKDQIILFRNGYKTEPSCPVCNNKLNDVYKTTCSKECREEYKKQKNILEESIKKAQETKLKKYGNKNFNNRKKAIETCIEKYGTKVSPLTIEKAKERVKELNEKGRKTLKEKYNVMNPGQLKDHRKKCKETLLKNYGVDTYNKSKEFKQKQKLRLLEKWSIPDIITHQVEEPDKSIIGDNPNKRVNFTCKICNNSETIPTETFRWRVNATGTPCSKCGNITKNVSVNENKIADFIEQYTTVIRNNKSIIVPYEIDIFLPDYNIGIEFNGLYWHSELYKDSKYHIDKTNECAKKGIRLIHIFEDEWLHKQDIVKSRLLNAIHKTEKRIYARKCKVMEVNPKEANSFINKNHLQGKGRANIHLGLYYNDELVSVMTFLNNDISKKLKGWELNRFCNKMNTIVVGGANKLFKYFIKHNNPKEITSFADKRWSTLDPFYTELGFTKEYDTVPNYWYIENDTRIHRYKLRKPENCNITERELRLQEGYLRIYDCGSSKFIWRPIE